jgi:hypothetical protein
MNSKPAAFMLFFRDPSPDIYAQLSPARRSQLIEQWNTWYDSLAARGKVQHGSPLELDGKVVSGTRGETVTDGPYAETKEAVAGYFWLTVADLNEAVAIAKQCPSLPLGMKVEVRRVAERSPVLPEIHGRPPKTAV